MFQSYPYIVINSLIHNNQDLVYKEKKISKLQTVS